MYKATLKCPELDVDDPLPWSPSAATVYSGALASLAAPQLALIQKGTIVATSDGNRWEYKGEGDKTLADSYILIPDAPTPIGGKYFQPGDVVVWRYIPFTKKDYFKQGVASRIMTCEICFRSIFDPAASEKCESFTMEFPPPCTCSDLESPSGVRASILPPTCGQGQVVKTWSMGNAGTCYSCEYSDPVVALGVGGASVWIG